MFKLELTKGNLFAHSVRKSVTLQRGVTRIMAFLRVILHEASHLSRCHKDMTYNSSVLFSLLSEEKSSVLLLPLVVVLWEVQVIEVKGLI